MDGDFEFVIQEIDLFLKKFCLSELDPCEKFLVVQVYLYPTRTFKEYLVNLKKEQDLLFRNNYSTSKQLNDKFSFVRKRLYVAVTRSNEEQVINRKLIFQKRRFKDDFHRYIMPDFRGLMLLPDSGNGIKNFIDEIRIDETRINTLDDIDRLLEVVYKLTTFLGSLRDNKERESLEKLELQDESCNDESLRDLRGELLSEEESHDEEYIGEENSSDMDE